MRSPLFALIVTAASLSALAQAPATPPRLPQPVADPCPVGLYANMNPTTATIWTTALEDQSNAAPTAGKAAPSGIHVEVSSTKKSIDQIELRVHYVPVGLRAMPLQSTSNLPDATKTFNLAAADGGALQLNGNLLVGPAATIQRVTVLSIRYADGSAWQPTAKQSCAAAVDHLMLINAK
jgi:hypothetical protein